MVNRWFERIRILTERGIIKWKYTYTVEKNCKRLAGRGLNHKFIIVIYDKAKVKNKNDYVGFIKLNITDPDEPWRFVKDGINEIEIFIEIIKKLIEEKESEAV